MDQRKEPVSVLLASDLDGTLLPVAEDSSHATAVRALRRRLDASPRLSLAYVTGRAPDDALAAVDRHGLPRPDVLATDVGTRVLWPDGDGWRRDDAYHDRVVAAMNGMTPDDVFTLVGAESLFAPQADAHQSDVKISFRLATHHDADVELDKVRAALAARGWRPSLVASRCVFTDEMLLDMLPGGVDKATAVHHIRKELKLTPPEVIYAGDSGNDLAPLTAGFKAIVVGNATPGLADRILTFAEQEGRPGSVHVSRRPHLHGVIEGATRFGVL